MGYDPKEQDDIVEAILPGLRATLADGARKRAAGTKPHWTIDQHEGSAFSHIAKAKKGETTDPDSGVHPYYHTAIRFAMMAWQESQVPEASDIERRSWKEQFETNVEELAREFKRIGSEPIDHNDPALD